MRRSRAVPAPAGKASRLGRRAWPGLLAGLMACAPKRGMKSRSCHEVRCDIEVLLETARDAGAVSGSMEGNVFETSGNACPGSSARRHLPQNGARTGAERPAPVRNRCGRRRGRGFQFAGTSTGVRAGARWQAARPRRPGSGRLPCRFCRLCRHWQPCRCCGICRAGVPELAKLFRKRFPAVSATCGRAAGLRAALPPAWPWLAPFRPETG